MERAHAFHPVRPTPLTTTPSPTWNPQIEVQEALRECVMKLQGTMYALQIQVQIAQGQAMEFRAETERVIAEAERQRVQHQMEMGELRAQIRELEHRLGQR